MLNLLEAREVQLSKEKLHKLLVGIGLIVDVLREEAGGLVVRVCSIN